ncbi:polysaccharide biosynthesis/export family protein [Flavobacterium sp. RSP29]|uniref:polysaccharide biosynthesis/export family protein n=1 Tax=Flavobacterium sp. RSP29 TaxID=3401731 RepID=UPI003AAE3DA0
MKKFAFPIVLLLVLSLQSCATKKEMLYLQDLDTFNNSMVSYAATKIQPNDILRIEVSDLNPLVAAPFNIGAGGGQQLSIEIMKLTGYLVTPEGTISMPVLDTINVVGLRPANLELKLKARLIDEGYLVNPTVQVRVINNKFTILGEVQSPGVKPFTEESIGLLDALGMAGDLTYGAIRNDIRLIRELEGKRLVYHIDLTTASWMSNPEFRIRQNDVIVVTPNKLKVNSGGLIKDPLQTIGIIASLMTLYFLILR